MPSEYDIYEEVRKLIALLDSPEHKQWSTNLDEAMAGAMASEILGDIMVVFKEIRRSAASLPLEAVTIQERLSKEIKKTLRRTPFS